MTGEFCTIDMGEGAVKGKVILLGVFAAACSPEEVEEPRTWALTLNHHLVDMMNRSTNHRCGHKLRGHDSSIRTSSRQAGAEVENTDFVFSKAHQRRLLHGPVWMRECLFKWGGLAEPTMVQIRLISV